MHDNKPGYYDCVLLSKSVRMPVSACTPCMPLDQHSERRFAPQTMTVEEFKTEADRRGVPKQRKSF